MDRHMQKRKSLPERRNFQEKSLPDIIRHHEMYIKNEEDAHSAPSSRSNSFRSKARPEIARVRVDNNYRRNSEPMTPILPGLLTVPGDHGEQLVRVRSFKTTSKGVINRGDSFRRASKGNVPPISLSKSDNALYKPTAPAESNKDRPSAKVSETPCSNCYKVAVVGADGVGKTALTQQFLTSENNFFNDSPTGKCITPSS